MKNTKLRLRIIKNLIPYTYKTKKFFLLLSFISLSNMLISLVSPILFKILVDDVIINKKLRMLVIVSTGYLGMYILNFMLDALSNYSSNRLLNKVLLNIRMKIWNKYLGMPFDEYSHFGIGELKIRMDEDVEKVNDFASLQTSNWIISLVTIAVTAIALFSLSWQLALFSMTIIPLTFYLGNIIGKGERILSEQRRKYSSERDSWLNSSLSGWKEVKALNLQKHEHRKFIYHVHRLALNNARWINYWVMQALVIPIIKDKFFMKFSLYFVGGLLVMKGHFTIGILLVFMRYYEIFCSNINQVNDCDIKLQESMPSYERLIEVLNFSGSTNDKEQESWKPFRNIKFNDVVFGYNEQLGYILKNISFDITRGEKIAIVGKSGSGKTTLLKLLLNTISCTEGKISIDETNIKDICPKELHKNIGVVMQDSFLFNVSVKENLKLAKFNATEAEILKACEMANIREFIEDLPDKYDTIVGERGVKLSGGQRQRIIIARVFLQQPEIVVFDEATSAVDQVSENFIQDSIRNLFNDKTVIIVSHRLSSILISDKIIVLKDKVIAGIGHHKELLGSNPAYVELFSEQLIS